MSTGLDDGRCRVWATGVFCLILAACGGNTQPPPSQPPPAPLENETLTNLVADETFDSAIAVLGFDVDGSGVTSNIAVHFAGISSVNTIAYDNAADSYTLSVDDLHLVYTQTFSPADIDQSRSDNTLLVYSVDNGGGDIREFVLLIPGDPVHNQSYVTLGAWNSTTAAPGFHGMTYGLSVFGIRTAASAVPTTGSGTYTGLTLGYLDAGNTFYQLTGDVQIDVDFGTSGVTGAFTNLIKENSVTGGLSAWRDFTATGSITAGTSLFTGTTQTIDTLLSGKVSGGFYGPAAQEIGGIWSLSGAGETAVGSFVGKQ